MNQILKGLMKNAIPATFTRKVIRASRNPPIGRVDVGDLRTLHPISSEWGYDRGQPIDRYYIDCFLASNADAIHGHVLEVGDDCYTLAYGRNRVTRSDILHVSPESRKATIVADLRNSAGDLAGNTFDCIICTQTLQFIYEVEAAIATLLRILKSNGSLLVTIPGISQISRYDMEHWGDYWRFTTATAERLFASDVNRVQTQVTAYGNVLSAVAFLHGLAAEELSAQELDFHDPDYQLLIAVRVDKGTG